MVLYDYRFQDCSVTGKNTEEYIVVYQVVPIDYFTNVPGPVSQSISESYYNAARNTRMSLTKLRMINN